TIRRFYECPDIHAIAVALPADKVAEFRDRDASVGLFKPVIYVSGGQERSDSILNALDAAAGLRPEIVAVHDAVRPFVTPAQIAAVIAGAKETGAAILALPATDTIKEVEDGVIVRTLDRRRIYRAHEEARAAGLPSAMLTDDSLLVERLGHAVAVVEGSASNIKITTPEDLLLAQKMFEEE